MSEVAKYVSRPASYRIKLWGEKKKVLGDNVLTEPPRWAFFSAGVYTTSDPKEIEKLDEFSKRYTRDFWRVDENMRRIAGEGVKEAKEIKDLIDARKKEVKKIPKPVSAPKMNVGTVTTPLMSPEAKEGNG
jgi:hypothetical protein